ncbi:MAG TPA: nicotinate-nucleotide--dimethylbenzimidazole phosphoribosyltransferase [Fusibacter sp.]|nr:nicotinate-nucleotide--dimethylbenzimidazole phosphoribosyltransferase [Fusibacter sp.]
MNTHLNENQNEALKALSIADYKSITTLDAASMFKTRIRVDNLVKPQGSLGALEEIAVQLSGIYASTTPKITKKAVIVMCADNGVCAEGIASAPPIVTLIQSLNIAKGVSGVGALAKASNAKVYTVNIGIDSEEIHPTLIHKKVMNGTHNIVKGHAMTREQALAAIETGMEMVTRAVSEGHNLIATGEMGIGNTTTTTAILSVLSGQDPKVLTGVGANFPVEKLDHKAGIIERSIRSKTIDANDPIDILSAVGGLDITGLTGVMLGGAIHRVPVIVDGYISTVAALLAFKINPEVKAFLFPSHASEEKSAALATELLGMKPFLNLNMRLGEGSGAVLAFGIIEAACTMLNDMITFEEAGIGVV